MSIQQLFHKFVSDPRLDEVIDALKKSNDIFDIIEPYENQHSQILAWLFNPREGHGQGDAILKDFLIAAYHASDDHVLANKIFFQSWPPSRIARAGFHSICLFPEFHLESTRRLDLLMVDFDNEILIVVENKYGARYSPEQLENYYTEVALMLRQRPVFQGFSTLHVAVDCNYRRRQGDEVPPSPLNRWAYIDYRWLERGARRAELQLKRGNQSAALVTVYCQAQTDYEPPALRCASDTLAELVRDYRGLVDAFAEARQTSLGELTPTGLNDDVWVYAHHHAEMVDRMINMEGLAFLEPGLRRALPALRVKASYGKEYVDFHADAWQVLAEQNDGQPLVVKVWVADRDANNVEEFGMALYYSPDDCSPRHATALRNALEQAFPELRKGRQTASYRTLGHVKSVAEAALPGKLRQLVETADAAVRAALA